MKRALLVLLAFAVAVSVAAGCDEPEADDGDEADEEEATSDEGEATSDEVARYQLEARASEATAILETWSHGARSYMEADQLYMPEGYDSEPWHPGEIDSDNQKPGMPVRFEDKVFPGGPDIRIVSYPEVPEDSEKIPFEPILEGDVDFDVESVLSAANIALEEDVYFRYTYETGPGKGADATAKVIAEANFDPSTAEYHTVIHELQFDPEFGVQVEERTENEFH